MKLSHPSEQARQPAVRLIVEAICTTCGTLADAGLGGFASVKLARRHTALTGHVVVLSGTTDLPESTEEDVLLDELTKAGVLTQWGEA